jgi:hypothetical protein
MGMALVLVIVLAAVGPLWLPFALAKQGRGALAAFCLTNLITALPMTGTSLWARYHPPPTCRQLYPDAPCDGIPYDAAWFFINALFVVLALWGLLASACATSGAFQKRP